MSNGKKRFCFETLLFLSSSDPLSWSFSGFCTRCFSRSSQECILDGQNQQFEEKELFSGTFSRHCHTLSEKTSAFLRNLLGMTGKSALYVSNGFVEHLKEKIFLGKSLLYAICGPGAKKLGFCGTFSGVGSKSAIFAAEKTNWVRKLLFPKLLFDKFHTMNFFETTYVIFVVLWDIEGKIFGLLAKSKDRGFQICTKKVQSILGKEIFFENCLFYQFQ